jgi:signal transduction histidine kinase
MAALADLAERTRQDNPVSCLFECDEPVSVADNLTATHLYLIAQEAVHNAIKHARPGSIRISLADGGRLVLRIRDYGAGLPRSPEEVEGLGLRIMQNRAAIIGARLSIDAVLPSGTIVTCTLTRRGDE